MASNPAKPEKKIAQQVDYLNSWWPGAESTRAEDAQPYLISPHAILGPELPAGCDL